MTIEELKRKLANPLELVSGGELDGDVCYDMAETIMTKFWIRKGDRHYWINDLEFYLFSDQHRDIITYPRKSMAGAWRTHLSGFDLCFESSIEWNKSPKNKHWLPHLKKDSFFGGLLIREIEPEEHDAIPDGTILDFKGPGKSFEELFAVFSPEDCPVFEPSTRERVVGDLKVCERKGFPDNVQKKVASIKTYYSDMYLQDSELEAAYTDYKEKKYHFIKQ